MNPVDELLPDDVPRTSLAFPHPARGPRDAALVLKRTYHLDATGRCEVASEDDQEPLWEHGIPWFEVDVPHTSPMRYAGDLVPHRAATDLVVQGSAQTYGSPCRQSTVHVRAPGFFREIVVHGDRTLEIDRFGRLEFGPAEAFEQMAIGYERAYGGVDHLAWLEWFPQSLSELARARPDLPVGLGSPFHYPRNPAGVGYLMVADPDAVEVTEVPNLEYPFDPITPDRMLVGAPERWPVAPLPAGLDWQRNTWFPRTGYLGLDTVEPAYRGHLQEALHGWMPQDLGARASMWKTPGTRVDPAFFQAASPGMSLTTLHPGVRLELGNLHPTRPHFVLQLPQEAPVARMLTGPHQWSEVALSLQAVVVRPDDGEVVMVWSGVTELSREHTPRQVEETPRRVEWRTVSERT